jgi:hypothetical protein
MPIPWTSGGVIEAVPYFLRRQPTTELGSPHHRRLSVIGGRKSLDVTDVAEKLALPPFLGQFVEDLPGRPH